MRLTYQISQRNKFVFAFYKSQGGTQRFDVGCTATSGNSVSCISPEAAYALPTPLQYAAQAKYTSPITSRFLLEIGQSLAVPTYKFNYQPENGPFDVDHFNRTTSVRTIASATAPQDYFNEIWNTIANVSYVTGGHNIKVGMNQEWGWSTVKVEPHGDMSVLTYVNSVDGCRDSELSDGAQHAVHPQGHPEGQFRIVRPGQVDDQQSDPDLRRPLRLLQRVRAGARQSGGAFRPRPPLG